MLVGSVCACSSSSGSTPSSQLAIVATSGAPLQAVAGDAIELAVVLQLPDGGTEPLPATSRVTWNTPYVVTALPPGSTGASPLPVAGAQPTAAWIENPGRPDQGTSLTNVLFFLDPGTVQNGTVGVSATVSGGANDGDVTASIDVAPTPSGDWTRGATLYGAAGANCAACHGATGHGSPGAPEAASYTIAGGTYDFPAPGLNAEPGHLSGNPAWNAPLFAVAARSDMNNGGLTFRSPMPEWLTAVNPATGKPLTTQDFADIYAFLKTQTQ
jgi:cytochrome c553